MRYVLIIAGCALVVAAIVLAVATRPKGLKDTSLPTVAPQGQEKGSGNTSATSEHGDKVWKQFTVTIEGKSYEVLLREYAQPLALRTAMEGFSPSKTSRQSAFGTLALTNSLGRHTKARADLEAYAQLFEDPAKAMAHYDWLQSRLGGWDALITGIREADEKNFGSMALLGEAIVADKHVFVFKMPETKPLFIVLRRKADGRYFHVNDWDESIRPLLYSSRLLQLFKCVKDEP